MRNLLFSVVVVFCVAQVAAGPAKANDNPAEAPDLGARITQLIQQLGHENYVLREQAQNELQRIGPAALDALAQAQNSDDIEIEMRARYLMTAIKIEWTVDSDPERVRTLMKDYAQKNDGERRKVIARLVELGGSPEVNALCRIIRFDASPIISKQAALALMDMNVAEDQWEDRTAAIAKNLANARVGAAEWLRVFARYRNDSEQAIQQWQRLADAERALWKSAAGKTNWQIVQALLFRLIDHLEKAGRTDDTEDYMRQIVELQPKDPDSIKRLVRWLDEKNAVRVVVVVAEKYPEIFQNDPLLLYSLAHAQEKLDRHELAEKSVQRAQQLNPSLPQHHLVIAYQLQERGWFEWAEQEYRIVVRITGMGHQLALRSMSLLSEMLHDQQQDKAAGDVLQELVRQLDADPRLRRILTQQLDREVGSVRSRMHFFFAADHAAQGNTEKQLQELDRALEADPTDADVLIAQFRLPNQSAERRAQTARAIQKAMDVFRENISDAPDDASPYNQFAWLVGNTVGEKDPDLADEAIAHSHRSLEKRPNAAGYLDTLGRCYYARGDIQKAVKYQRQAAQRDPHSGLIRRQLELFEKKLAESESKG